MLMNMAEASAQRSTCSRFHVGAIAAIESRPLVSGYNGTPAGMPHCDHTCTCAGWTLMSAQGAVDFLHEPGCPAFSPCLLVVHAEANAIAFAARHGIQLSGATLYTTLEPCFTCAQLIINAGIVEVVYNAPYRDHAGFELLQTAGVRTWYLT